MKASFPTPLLPKTPECLESRLHRSVYSCPWYQIYWDIPPYSNIEIKLFSFLHSWSFQDTFHRIENVWLISLSRPGSIHRDNPWDEHMSPSCLEKSDNDRRIFRNSIESVRIRQRLVLVWWFRSLLDCFAYSLVSASPRARTFKKCSLQQINRQQNNTNSLSLVRVKRYSV